MLQLMGYLGESFVRISDNYLLVKINYKKGHWEIGSYKMTLCPQSFNS